MPGVQTQTVVRSGPTSTRTGAASTYFVSGITERGPHLSAYQCRSMADYTRVYGDRVPYGTVYDDVRTFFEEGGGQVVVCRATGPSPTYGTLTLGDSAAAATLTVKAISVGTWAQRVSVQVLAGSTAATFTVVVSLDGIVKETYTNLTSPAAAAVLITNSSNYVSVVDQGNVKVAPANNPAPTASATPLTAGDAKHALVDVPAVLAALELAGEEFGTGVVACPTFPVSATGAGLKAHCRDHKRVALAGVGIGSSATQAKAASAALSVQGDTIGVVWPNIIIPNGPTTQVIGPEGFAAAQRAKNVVLAGPWQYPAGQFGTGKFAVGTDAPLSRALVDDLDANGVIPVRVVSGAVKLYGWRSASVDLDNFPSLASRDLLNYLEVQALQILEPYVFSIVDSKGHLFSALKGELQGMVAPLLATGALYPGFSPSGQKTDDGFSIDVGPAVNTVDSLRRNEVRAVLGIRPAPTAALITLTIVRAGLAAAV